MGETEELNRRGAHHSWYVEGPMCVCFCVVVVVVVVKALFSLDQKSPSSSSSSSVDMMCQRVLGPRLTPGAALTTWSTP
jgi:hypothetical protein